MDGGIDICECQWVSMFLVVIVIIVVDDVSITIIIIFRVYIVAG